MVLELFHCGHVNCEQDWCEYVKETVVRNVTEERNVTEVTAGGDTVLQLREVTVLKEVTASVPVKPCKMICCYTSF